MTHKHSVQQAQEWPTTWCDVLASASPTPKDAGLSLLQNSLSLRSPWPFCLAELEAAQHDSCPHGGLTDAPHRHQLPCSRVTVTTNVSSHEGKPRGQELRRAVRVMPVTPRAAATCQLLRGKRFLIHAGCDTCASSTVRLHGLCFCETVCACVCV